MNKKLNITAITIIVAGLCVLAFIKLNRQATAKKLAAWEQQFQRYDETTNHYNDLTIDSRVLISDVVAKNINEVIPHLDSNIFSEGRDISQAEDPNFAYNLVRDTEHGGYSVDRTFFKDDYFKDGVVATVSVMYDKASLKLLKTWQQPAKAKHFDYIETRYAYSGKIKVEYEVIVDGEKYKGVYYQQSQINSPMDLLYKYKS